MEKLRRSKRIRVLFFSLFVLVLGISTIYSYLIDKDTAQNVFAVGANHISIIEEFTPPKIQPGANFKKDVRIRNEGPNDCFTRVKVVFSDSDIGKYCTINWNTMDWKYDNTDGYYYYTKILKEDDITSSLFTTVSVSSGIPEENIKDVDILVYAESYQCKEYTNYKDAWIHYQMNK